MQIRVNNRFYQFIILFLIILMASVRADLIAAGIKSNVESRVWPAPPAPAKVTYVRQITGPDDLGVSRGLLQQLSDLISGPSQVHLVRPTAIVEGPAGALYIADPGVRGIHYFNADRNQYHLIKGPNGHFLRSPVALAAGADGEIYVSDSRAAGVFLIKPGAKNAARMHLQGLLARPTGLAFEPSNKRLFVVDTANHNINVFAKDGTLLYRIGKRGKSDGEFNYPTMIWIDKQGRLIVADTLNFRIQILDLSGNFLGKFGNPGNGAGQIARPKGVAMDSDNHVYVVDSMLHTLQIFDVQGKFLLKLGQRGERIGEFWLPTGIFIGAGNTIYVADSYNSRVQVFRYIGGETP